MDYCRNENMIKDPETGEWISEAAYMAWQEEDMKRNGYWQESQEENEPMEAQEENEQIVEPMEAQEEIEQIVQTPIQTRRVYSSYTNLFIWFSNYSEFIRKIKFKNLHSNCFIDGLDNLIKNNDVFYIVFKIATWGRMEEYNGVEINSTGNELDYFDIFRHCFARHCLRVEILETVFDTSLEDIWKLIQQRLNNIMTSSARQRTGLFLEFFNDYLVEEQYLGEGRKRLSHCFQEFYNNNKVTCSVCIFMKLPNQQKMCIGNRIYREDTNLTPLGDKFSFNTLKKDYKPCVWKTVVKKDN